MKIILAQTPIRTDLPSDNLHIIRGILTELGCRDAEMLILPRLALSGRLSCEALERPAIVAQYRKAWLDFLEVSREHPGITIGTSVLGLEIPGSFQRDFGAETAIMIKAGQVIYRQPRILGTSELPPESWPSFGKDKKIRLLLGGDLRLPGASHGADIIITLKNKVFQGNSFVPAAEKYDLGFWRLNVSCVGGDGPTIYEGATTITCPKGGLKAWSRGFDRALMEFDTHTIAENMPNVSTEPAEPTAALYEALKIGFRDFVTQAGFKKVVLGLSGGLDSAVAAALAAAAMGPEAVLGVALPSIFNAPESLTDARELAVNLKIPFLTLPINDIKESFEKAFVLDPPGEDYGLAQENLQPRIRGTLLMYLANRDKRLLISTSNKSEAAVGYTTLYGDMCGALAPLGDVYKTQVYELANYINRYNVIIPERTISRPPSAELRPDQKDEDSLPPYEILDDILRRHLEGRQSGAEIAKDGSHQAMTVAWALSSMKRAAFKRIQAPPCLVVSVKPLSRQN